MAKRKKKNDKIVSWLIPIFAAACGVTAFAMIFASSVSFQSLLLGRSEYTGLQTAFGYTVSGIELFKASAGVILAYFLPLAAAACAVFGKQLKPIAFVSAAIFIAGAVLAFLIPEMLTGNFVGTPSLATGAVLCGTFSIVGAVSSSASAVLF